MTTAESYMAGVHRKVSVFIATLGSYIPKPVQEKLKESWVEYGGKLETMVGGTEDMLWWYRVRGTVILTVWWKVVLVLIYTFFILFIHTFICRLDFPQTLIPILGVVVSLLLGFRTNSAYDRYWEGRKIWTQITQDVRKLTRCIWAGVDEPIPKSIIEKKSALNLLLAFVVATKHYLREEYSDQYEDLRTLIDHLPRFITPPGLNAMSEQQSRKSGAGRSVQLMAYEVNTPTNIPIEISYYILSYIKYVNVNNLAPAWAISTMQSSLSSLVDSFSNFERILRTPIPMAYSIHLHITVWLYILSLPFQIIGTVGWMALPVVGLGSFCLLGILAVAYEIENPFGYDENDLPLDDFCEVLRAEMDMITGSRMLDAEEWMYSDLNRPFAPATNVSFKGLSYKKKEQLMEILAKTKEMHNRQPAELPMEDDTAKSKHQ